MSATETVTQKGNSTIRVGAFTYGVRKLTVREWGEGADLVIGHHPHVPQGIGFHQGTPICHSLGNFVFFQPTDLLFRKIGYLVKARFTPQGLARLRLVPYEIHSGGVRLPTDRQTAWVFNQLKKMEEGQFLF